MNIFGWLFGGSNSADKVIDSATSGIDKIFYTDEEKADARKEGFKLWIEYQKATAPQNVSRRLIAVMVTALWVFSVLLYIGLQLFFPDMATPIFQTISSVINPPFMLVIGFYFAKRIVEGFKGR